MKAWRVATGLALAMASPGIAADGPSSLFTGADLFSLSIASDPQISPDGRSVAYVRRSNDIMTDKARNSIWLVDVATGAERPLVDQASSPRWSPDGRRIAYVAADGDAAQLFVMWLDSGKAFRLTGLPDAPQAMQWSPDGRRIAYSMTVPGDAPKLGNAPPKPDGAKWAKPLEIFDKVTYRADGAGYLKAGFDHLFVIDALGGAPRQLTFGNVNDGGPSWTHDGTGLLFAADRSEDWELAGREAEIFRVSLDGSAPVALTSRKGPDFSPKVSPDGRHIAYLGFDDTPDAFEQAHLYVMAADGSGSRLVAPSLDRSIDAVEWAGDGAIFVQYEEEGSSTVARVTLDGRVTPITRAVGGGGMDRPYAGGAFSVARNGVVAFTTDRFDRPADLAVASGGKTRTLTRLNDLSLGAKNLGTFRPLDATAPDGGRVPGWILLPPTWQPGQKVPTILEIHGGPYASYGPHFSTDYQLYAAAGYAVLYTNPRGSTGYGERFADGIEKTYPASNFDDLMASVDQAIASGYADPDNLFVTGGSGGGILTAWIVGKTRRFKAAAAQKPVINWTSMALTSDGTPFFGRYWIGKQPWEDYQSYWSRSPLSLMANVATPTLVVVGSEDYRTPVSEAEQLYSALKLQRVPTMLVKVPDASHGGIAARPSQSAAKASAIISWFDRYRTK